MRIITLILLAMATVALNRPATAHAAEPASVRAILITASNEKAPADPKLAAFEGPLQRNLPESSFRYVAEGSASVGGNGRATISLGRGHRVDVELDKSDGSVRLKIQWMNGNELFMGGTFTPNPGAPIVLGRRPTGEGNVPIVLVIAK